MNDRNKALTTPDETPTSGTPAPSDQPGADETAGSSPASPDVTEESSTSTGDKPATLGDAISKVLGPAEDEAEGEAATATPAEAEAESGETSDEEPEGNQDEPAQAEKKDDLDLTKLSKRARTRIEELARENRTYRETLEEIKRYTGDDGFDGFRTLVRKHHEDPAEAVPMLEQLLQDARERAGLVVKSDDIKRKLDDGVIDDGTAVELEQARVEKQRQQQRKAAERETSMVRALDAWEKSVKERTPDFDDVVDLVRDRFVAKLTRQPAQTPEEAVAIAQEAFDEVTGKLRKFQPQKTVRQVATSSGPSAKATPRPRSIEDIVNRLE